MTASLPIATSVLREAISTRAPTFSPTHFAPLVNCRPPFTNSAFSSLSNPSFPSAKRYQTLYSSSCNEEGFVADEEEEEEEEDGFEIEEESDGGDIVSFDLRELDKEAKDAVREHSLSLSQELIIERPKGLFVWRGNDTLKSIVIKLRLANSPLFVRFRPC
ncbi:hypothetical protein Syun_019143 [Stephania yunnanensis]|uniref:Uncharacterized protein n=1 Tax=Stephania yunnanensis TaxID=152371 RepID=A0AAP0NZ47_9MAGN